MFGARAGTPSPRHEVDPPTDPFPVQQGPDAMRPPTGLTRSVSLRGRVTVMAATVVGVAVAVLAAAAYLVVQNALYDDVDTQLQGRSSTLLSSSASLQGADPRASLGLSALFSSDLRVAVIISREDLVIARAVRQTLAPATTD